MVRKISLILVLIALVNASLAQELNCKVTVNSDQIQGSDKHIYETLKTAIFEFMNNRKWTSEVFKAEERIECNILINISDRPSADKFTASIQVAANRPIYKSSYNSPLFNYNDKEFTFTYIENQSLDFSENAYSTNLTSVLGFYAYFIIGMQYDTFSMNGGTAYLQKALSVVNNAQSTEDKGWKAFDGTKNRYWLVNNMLDASFIPLRECLYNYHRKGLDMMVDNKETGRATILESIDNLKKIHEIKPLSFSLQVFFIAKSEEIINIFSGGFPDEKAKMVATLNEIDPTNSNKYQKIIGN